MVTFRSPSLGYVLSGALGASIALTVFACMGAGRTSSSEADAQSIAIKDEAGNVRIFLGPLRQRGPDQYGIELFGAGGEKKLFQVTTTTRGVEAWFNDLDGDPGIFFECSGDGPSINLFRDHKCVAQLDATQSEAARLVLWKLVPTTFDGQSVKGMKRTVNLPE